jgi:hypothetical protein
MGPKAKVPQMAVWEEDPITEKIRVSSKEESRLLRQVVRMEYFKEDVPLGLRFL